MGEGKSPLGKLSRLSRFLSPLASYSFLSGFPSLFSLFGSGLSGLGIDSTPKILYDAEDVNIPELTYIRLQYRRVNDQEKIFEIYQRYTPDAGMRTTYPEMAHEGAKVILLDWISYPKFLSEAEMEVAMTRTQMASSVFQTNGTVWWLDEITDPSGYRSTMTKWIKDHVEYRILSYLPAEEIEKVTLSMLECSNP